MIKDWKAPILATVGLASLAIAIPVGLANAQVPPPGQGGQRNQAGGEFQRPPGQPGGPDMQAMQRGMMGGGGQATMVTDNQFLFILQGNMLYKVNKNNLEVIGQGMLPMPQQMGRGGFEGGAPGTRGGGGGEVPSDSAPTVK